MKFRKALGAACSFLFAAGIVAASIGPAAAQAFPPGTFAVDGFPVVCGPETFVVTSQIPDVGINDGRGVIYLNPVFLQRMSTPVKLFWVAHECGHFFVGSSEAGADCWAIRTGRNQGWFPPQAFQELMYWMQNNPGDFTHAPGPERIRLMWQCYNS